MKITILEMKEKYKQSNCIRSLDFVTRAVGNELRFQLHSYYSCRSIYLSWVIYTRQAFNI